VNDAKLSHRFPSNQQQILRGLILLVVTAGAIGLGLHWRTTPAPINNSPVPKAVAQAVNFLVYYPDQKKLPPGYNLNTNSFNLSPDKKGVYYSVSYGANKKIVFSVQVKPSDNELQSFNSNYIPLRVDYQTPIGQAEIGAYHSQTLVSLPVINGPWIVITAPPDINQDQLKQVLRAIKASS
jgi:hypothetical protein